MKRTENRLPELGETFNWLCLLAGAFVVFFDTPVRGMMMSGTITVKLLGALLVMMSVWNLSAASDKSRQN